MSDQRNRDLLDEERRRYRMPNDSYHRLHQRRDRKRRNRMIASGVLGLVIAAGGGLGAALAFRNTGGERRPAAQVTPSVTPSSSPSSTPSPGTTAPPQLFPSQPSSPIQAVGTNDVWYVGVNGEIVHQAGGGDPAVFETGFKVGAVQFIDTDHGWALAPDQLLRTTDGKTWAQAGEPDQPLRSVQFVTPDIGWGIAGQPNPGGADLPGILVRSDDGGMTWQEAVPTPEHPESICFVSDSIGWSAKGRSVFSTSDGGQTWSSVTLDLTDNEEPWSATLGCANESEAWVLLRDGGAAGHLAHVLFHTADAGATWTPVLQEAGTMPLGQGSDVYASDDPYPGPMSVTGAEPGGLALVTWCPACGNIVWLQRTGDGGKTWERHFVVSGSEGGVPEGVSFIDPDHGWLLLTVKCRCPGSEQGGKRRLLLRTDNGGKAWAEEPTR
jgi:photosystem II stability/assembly factor-like uncharacterized protein